MEKPISILLVDDEADFRAIISDHLEEKGYQVFSVGSGQEAISAAQEQDFDVALLDVKMPGMDGVNLLQMLKEIDPSVEVIMLTGHATIETAVQSIKLGALDYLSKPVRLSELEVTIARALEVRHLRRQAFQLRERLRQKEAFPEIIGKSRKILAIQQQIEQVAQTDATVLIEGESGSGKELVAKAIHRRSKRGDGPFIVLNCGALQESLLENELFGHEKGAFTGASTEKRGLVEVADGGTLFVDEVAEMSLACQTRFLRILEAGDYRRLGSTKDLKVDLRIIAATNKKLAERAKQGQFREDLFYRLNVFRIVVPPLRERKEDIPILIGHFLANSEVGPKPPPPVSPEALESLMDYSWPGNVREVANVVERTLIVSQGLPIRPQHLNLTSREVPLVTCGEKDLLPLEQVERDHIQKVLAAVSGNKRRAARILGISLRNLYRKLEHYGLANSEPLKTAL
ncbi:MAG: sigma-54-dependent Fis family transcriptional regulator [Deltaproteobacteria bacterium]|nr:sigma-54-dependent Fis family transcriptional regulator [Deltaproteobacteria bacterium]